MSRHVLLWSGVAVLAAVNVVGLARRFRPAASGVPESRASAADRKAAEPHRTPSDEGARTSGHDAANIEGGREGVAAARSPAPVPGPAPWPGDGQMPPMGPGGFGPPGGPPGQKREIVKEFDRNGDGWLNSDERQAAREALRKDASSRTGRRGFGPPRGGPMGAENQDPPAPGPRVSPEQAKAFPDAPLYAPEVLRTLFLEFDNPDWEAELTDFYRTDVDVPATLIVDGRRYPGVGVHFRGNTSFNVGAGRKRSLNVSLDMVDSKQRLYGYKTLNLLNSHGDPTFLRAVLYLHISRQYIRAPQANLVKVVINGESWGIYANVQQVDRVFAKEAYGYARADRWKVPVDFRGGGALGYPGDNIDAYRNRYILKSESGDDAWQALIGLCRILSNTPPERLEEALSGVLDIEGTLWFLAIDNVLINNDGYWTRGSDYNLCRDGSGRFHIVAHDVNETLSPAGGPGFGGGPGGPSRRGPGGFGPGGGGGGVELDPLAGASDPNRVLLNRLLAVPRLRARYLEMVRTIARDWLDWQRLGPLVAQYRALIEAEVAADTRKLYSLEAFRSGTADTADGGAVPGRDRRMSLRAFADQRRAYLLNHAAIRDLPAAQADARR